MLPAPVLLDPVVESAFIRAIQAAPRSLDARLIYADWLDEQGDARAEYLRLQCRVADPREMRDVWAYASLRDQLTALGERTSPDWLAMIDASEKFTLLWPLGAVDHLGFVAEPGQAATLRSAAGETAGERGRRPRVLHFGAYVYPLFLSRGSVSVVARMRIAAILDHRDFSDLHAVPHNSHEWATRHRHDLLLGDRGTESRMARIPVPVLQRLRFFSRSGSRGVQVVEGRGRMTAARAALRGAHRLTPESAFDFDCLLAGVDPG